MDKRRSLPALLLGAAVLPAAHAQEHLDEPDNGTNPARLRRLAMVSFEHLELRGDPTRGTFKAIFETPVTDKASFRIQVPLARVNDDDQPVKDDFRRGDIALRLNYIYDVNRERGIVMQGELTTDTASKAELGNGKAVFKATYIYALFLKGGDIFGPSFSQSNSFGGDPARPRINNLLVDLYYVPKLADRRHFVTIDPAVTFDWENKTQYGSLSVTYGRVLGKAFGGSSQVYIKPSVFLGGHRSANWAIEVAFKLLGF